MGGHGPVAEPGEDVLRVLAGDRRPVEVDFGDDGRVEQLPENVEPEAAVREYVPCGRVVVEADVGEAPQGAGAVGMTSAFR